MKAASDKLKQLLLSQQTFYMTELYEITLQDDTVLRYTSCDIPIKTNGITYKPLAIERGTTTQTNDISVDQLDVTINAGLDEMINDEQTIMQGVVAGSFEEAKLVLYRLFSPDPFSFGMGEIDSDYVLLWWLGTLNIESAGGLELKATVSSLTELLNTKFPTHLYYPPCIHTLGDVDCKIQVDAFKITGYVRSGTRSVIQTNLSIADGYLTQGSICFTSGKNTGITRSIRINTAGEITVVMPFYYVPAAGDTFYVIPACDKSMNCCRNRFNNINHFRGYPFIPVPETAH